jgi:tRNA nucleotidyltransferase (CCA-adding enzyme)
LPQEIQSNIEDFLFRNLPIDRAWLPQDTYLVGGSVRDVLLSRTKAQFDLDFVVAGKTIELASQIARHYRVGFVVLDDARHIARVVFPQGTIDLARREGESMETDLQRRDYTVNAIAYNLHDRAFCDPHGGLDDLNNKILRAISRCNLEDDPLRLLRGYRQAAQLGFSIAPDTRDTIRDLAPLLDRVAAERVNMELGYLLESDRGSEWLSAAVLDRLFAIYFPELTDEKLSFLHKVDEYTPNIIKIAQKSSEKSKHWRMMARLACLVSRSPQKAEAELTELKYSRQEIRTIVTALEYLPQLLVLKEIFSLREQYFFFLAVGDVLPILAILGLAFGGNGAIISLLLERYCDRDDLVAHPQPLVTGTDLIRELSLKPSPTIGYLLTEIQVAAIEGKVGSFSEAIEFGKEIIGLPAAVWQKAMGNGQ